MRIHLLVLITLSGLLVTIGGWLHQPFAVTAGPAQPSTLDAYPIGTPTLTNVWVDPTNGQDDDTGADRAHALATIAEAWRRIPSGAPLTITGYRIQLVAGDYPESNFPEYWEDRHGSAQFPIILQAADGALSARLLGDLNLYNISYFYILGLTLQHGGDVFHCEQCDHLLVRDSALIGSRATSHENVKVNQSQHIYLEGNDIGGAEQNAIDFVAVQHGHILHNHIHHADDWCMYLKGGSAHFRIEGNEIDTCGTGGFTAGEGTGLEYMVAPWLHYEAYDLKVVNNVIHDTDGAGLGVNGGYDILFAYNTLYRVGARSHVLEFGFGGRSCDGDQALAGRCAANLAVGGWGTATVGGEAEPIPNRNIYVYNNLIYNPPSYHSQWQHLAIYGPRTPGNGSNIATPAQADANLVIRGNVIWNGPADHPLGIGEDSGCQPGNPTCNATQLLADNTINSSEPALIDPSQGDFRPAANGNLANVTTYALPTFPAWDTFTPVIPAGDLINSVPVDRNGVVRSDPGLPGAYANANSTPVATVTPSPVITTPVMTNTATATTSAAVTTTATPINTSIATLPATGNAAYIYLPAIAQRAENPIPATLTATPTSPAIGTLTATPTTIAATATATPTITSTAVTAATATPVATTTITTTPISVLVGHLNSPLCILHL